MGRIYIYETKLKENLNICVLNCLSISKSHGCPVRVVYNGIELMIDRKVDSRKAFWVEMYQTKLNNKKAPFTPAKEDMPPFPVQCSRCGKEWKTCKHSDGSTEASELDDNMLWFFFGCLFGLFAAYIIGT